MLTDPFAPRNLVRKRIIRRNVNYPSMKSFYVFGTLAGLALLPVTFMVFAGMVSPWMPALPMFIMLASVAMYTHYWFKMIDHMKTSTRDRKFVNKMLKEEFW
jgi:hypothetical protein